MLLREEILVEARTWLGTPWKHNQCLKGIGCDCVNFPHAVYRTSGIAMPDLFNYSRTPKGERILDYLDQTDLNLVGVAEDLYSWSDARKDKAVPLQDLIDLSQPGDLLVYSRVYGGPPGHLAIRTIISDDSPFSERRALSVRDGKIEALYKLGVTESGMGAGLKLLAVYSCI